MALQGFSVRDLHESLGEYGVLMIKLEGRAATLGMGLQSMAGTELGPQAADALDFRTSFADADGAEVEKASQFEERTDREDASLLTLRESALFVVPLRKRSDGAAFLDKITVGRTRNHDVVLREPSVSKFHAMFAQRDGRLHLQDMGSKNGTRVNGTGLEATCPLTPGDTITFGSVEATYVTWLALWRAVRTA